MRLPFPFSKRHNAIEKSPEAYGTRSLTRAELIADEIMRLFENYGAADHNGAPVSQTSHMVQCAMLAMESISDLPVIIGALLHDIGQLLKREQFTEAMGDYGMINHEGIGAAYLRSRGFSERVCTIVAHHVSAKRYLVATDRTYQRKLSPASLKTLEWQGGPMTLEEVAAFEKQPYFLDMLNVCRWDEEAKSKEAALLPASWFRRIIWDHLTYRVQ